MAKSRVAPIKPLTLPKLELMGALTAARLCNFIVQALYPHNLSTHFWSDSQITLHWIKGKKHVNTFVTHRIVEILNHSEPDQWQYCPTQDNPAGLLTRGINSSQLNLPTLWKHGHQWLLSENSWPTWSFPPTFKLQALAVTATSFSPSATNSMQVLYTSTVLLISLIKAHCLNFWLLLHTCLDLLPTVRSQNRNE